LDGGVVFYILQYQFDKKKEENKEEQPEETTEVIEEGDNI
jgi:hypothetical protein